MTIPKITSDPTSTLFSETYKAFSYNPVPLVIAQAMTGKSYKVSCPVPITDLAYVQISHYNMSGEVCLSELIVHKKNANITMKIFEDIFAAKFPIEKMRLIDEYNANDNLSMEDNNSSAFCFRSITGQNGDFAFNGARLRLNPLISKLQIITDLP